MNLKNCLTKPEKHYVPHKLRSHPIRCLSLPILALFLFILFWFIICPLIFVDLLKQHGNWPNEWPYYYWATALIIFIILLAILVCFWRLSRNSNEELCKTASDSLLNNAPSGNRKTSKQKEIYTISLNTIQKSQEKLDIVPNNFIEKPQNCSNIPCLEEKLEENRKGNLEHARDEADTPRITPEKKKARPKSLAIAPVTETRVELHSTASPLSPREIFFWDLIQNANKCRNSTTYNFIEHEKQLCSFDNLSVSSPKVVKPREEIVERWPTQRQTSSSSAEYFIANVPDRRSLAAEVFLYVDGGQEEKCLRIRSQQDCNDNVFSD